MNIKPWILGVMFLLGVGAGWLIFSRQELLSNGASSSRDSESELEKKTPSVATLMSDETSHSDACYFLNTERANSQLDRLDVFEAMVFHPNTKGGPILSFWTDEPIDFWNDLPCFKVFLIESLPRSLHTLPVRHNQVLVVRLIGRLRELENGYYLDEPTLLGHTVMTLEAASKRSSLPHERSFIRYEKQWEIVP